jgi:hypothetical protein
VVSPALQKSGPKPSQPQASGGVCGREQMKADRMKAAAEARQAKEVAKARVAQVRQRQCAVCAHLFERL